ncbi:MAG TPA: hypothetical protein VMU12_00555 [Candidatus Paceibacterota bacterium]|nr:hypothetical protein [Candidatus Paceibacterota bacterium]
MKKHTRLVLFLIALTLVVTGSLGSTKQNAFVPGGGHFRGHGASSSW